MSATVDGQFCQAATDDLGGGAALFLVAPEPTSLLILVVGGLACLTGRRTARSSRTSRTS